MLRFRVRQVLIEFSSTGHKSNKLLRSSSSCLLTGWARHGEPVSSGSAVGGSFLYRLDAFLVPLCFYLDSSVLLSFGIKYFSLGRQPGHSARGDLVNNKLRGA